MQALLPGQSASPPTSAAIVSAALDFRSRELAFLHGLSIANKQLLVPSWTGPGVPFPAHHILFSGYVALVLLGAKPCAVFGNGRWPGLAAAISASVLEPWFISHGLAAHGVRFERIDSALVPSEVPGHPGFRSWGLLLSGCDAAGSARAAAVLLSGAPTVHNADIGAALGYPGSEGHASSACIFYMAAGDDAPYRDPAHPAEPICCVPLVEFRAGREDAASVGAHFRRSADAVAAAPGLGLALALDLQDCEGWGAAALAALCTAGFGSKARLLAAVNSGELRMWPWMAAGGLLAAVRLMPE